MTEISGNPLKKSLHTLIKVARQDMVRRLSAAKIGITPLQFWVLKTVAAGPLTVNEVAREFNIMPPSLTPVVHSLEEDGYLVRRPDEADRRKLRLVVTPSGSKLVHRLSADDKNDALAAAFGRLSAAKQKSLLGLLQELIKAIE